MIFLLFFVDIGLVFNDLPLANYIGTIGSSLMFILVPITFIIIFFQEKFKISITDNTKLFLYYYLVSLFFSILIFLLYFISYESIYTPYGQLIPIKLAKASLYNLVYFFVYFTLVYIFLHIDMKKINLSIKLIFWFLIVIGVIEILNKDFLNFLHLFPVEYKRLRLTTAEPSRAFFLLTIIGLLIIFFEKKIITKIITLILLMLFDILIASKGGWVFIMLSLLLVYLFNVPLKQKLILLSFIIPLFIVFVFVFLNIIQPELINDLEKFHSTSTRAITSVWALLSLVHFPFGEGYGTYLCYFQDVLRLSKEIIFKYFPYPLSAIEIDSMIDTGKNVGVKSGILFQIVQNGVVAVVFYFLLFRNSYKYIEKLNFNIYDKYIIKVIITYTLLTLILGINIEVMYVYLLPIAYIEALFIKQQRLYVT